MGEITMTVFDTIAPWTLINPLKIKPDGKEFPDLPLGVKLVGLIVTKEADAIPFECFSVEDIRELKKMARTAKARVRWYSAPKFVAQDPEVNYVYSKDLN